MAMMRRGVARWAVVVLTLVGAVACDAPDPVRDGVVTAVETECFDSRSAITHAEAASAALRDVSAAAERFDLEEIARALRVTADESYAGAAVAGDHIPEAREALRAAGDLYADAARSVDDGEIEEATTYIERATGYVQVASAAVEDASATLEVCE